MKTTEEPESSQGISPADKATDVVLMELPCGRLAVRRGDETIAVQLRRCFPWSTEATYLSLRDFSGNEVALVQQPGHLDADSRAVLERALRVAAFVLEIERIEQIEEELEVRTWTVRTGPGWRRFQTRLDEWPTRMPDGCYLVRDVCGDSYIIPKPETLDPFSRETLAAYIT